MDFGNAAGIPRVRRLGNGENAYKRHGGGKALLAQREFRALAPGMGDSARGLGEEFFCFFIWTKGKIEKGMGEECFFGLFIWVGRNGKIWW